MISFFFQVSETENIRKNLAIERMIVEGCDILLDVNQMFVRQGTLVQIHPAGHKSGARGRLAIVGKYQYLFLTIFLFQQTFFSISTHFLGRDKERESVRQCFLFSNHLILTSRTQGGKLHLVENVGKIPLADITLIEDPNEENVSEEPGKTKMIYFFLTVGGVAPKGGGEYFGLESPPFFYHNLCKTRKCNKN